MRRLHFRLPDLPRVREFAACGALELGMRKEAVDDFVIAVNEVATNAVTHGDDAARVRLWSDSGEIVIEVHDGGTWKPGPQPGSVGGMGLWVARLLASDLTLRVGGDGSTVIMRFPGKADV
ncbi:ATP-binding protein [Nonomuraea sp. MCN248]|uniref:ATP-binding protein n=1 Tax=Nonomuraea corallina TaxID=2989783 RepID=A0ABT4SGV0_9ACTN|nr:ATP-binding protein [Nonomuraea corallina]MDA0636379.1 ATP-binding protein [Nonomuraea corallina]